MLLWRRRVLMLETGLTASPPHRLTASPPHRRLVDGRGKNYMWDWTSCREFVCSTFGAAMSS
jgi:hypothetical protein